MATVPIPLPTLLGGISRQPTSQRSPSFVEDAVNITINPSEGISDRPGTEFIEGEADSGALAVTGTLNRDEIKVGWIDRDLGEQFLYLIVPGLGDTDNDIIQIFDLDGNKQTITYDGDSREYLAANSAVGDARRRLRGLTVADTTFLLNRTVETGLKGGELTYQAQGSNLRNQTNPQNVGAWNEFDHPPGDLRDLDANPIPSSGTVADDAFWYASEDDVGQPQGFYAAISSTAPPWFTRIRTEGANSEIDEETMPLRLDFDGTDFELKHADWTPRLSGDSGSNPPPALIGSAISDITFHQNRLFLSSGERLQSSQAGRIFDLWQRSSMLQIDSDPLGLQLAQDRLVNVDHMVPFQQALILLTNGARQLEVVSDGALTPGTVSLLPSSSVKSVDYANPAKMGSSLFFLGERNFSNILYEYFHNPGTVSNAAEEVTRHVEGLIPAAAHQVEASENHNMIFILTDAEPDHIFIYKSMWQGDRRILSSWFKWQFEGGSVWSVKVLGDYLYMAIERGGELFLERLPIDAAQQDVHGTPPQTMGFNVRLDRKQLVQGVYDADEGTTTWTLPFADEDANEIVLGPTWDQDSGATKQRLAGVRLTPTVEIVAGETVLTVDGQYATNILDENAPAYVGRVRSPMQVRLSRQYARDQEGAALFGNTHLLTGKLRFRNSGYFRVEVTPQHREARHIEYISPRVSSTELDGEFILSGEHFFRVMANAAGVEIDIVNDSPLPSTIIDGEFQARVIPYRKSPAE